MSRKVGDWLDNYITFNANSEPPLLFHTWVGISVIASVLQRKCSLPWGTITFYPNLYIVLVAPSGRARKGIAMGPGFDFLDDIGVKLAAEAVTREALIRELKTSSATVVHSDGSCEFHSSLTIFSQELIVFLGYQNHQLMSDLTDWYDCRRRWTYRTKNMGTDDIIGVWVNLIGATTPELIQSNMSLEAIGGGLTSRMIFVFEQKRGKIAPVPFLTQKEKDLREDLLLDLEKILMLQGEFTVTDNFLEYWIKWYTDQSDSRPFEDDRFSGYFERRPTHVMKLSMVMCASRCDDLIMHRRDLMKAIDILERTEVKMPMTFSGVGKSSNADVINKVMAEVGRQKECTFAHLMGMFYRDVDKFMLENILQSLEAMNFVKVVFKGEKKMIVYTKGE